MNDAKLRNMLQVQFTRDYNCFLEDFENTNTLITSKTRHPERRLYEDEDSIADLLIHEGKLIVSVAEEFFDDAEEYFDNAEGEWFLDTDEVIAFDRVLGRHGYEAGSIRTGFIPRSESAVKQAAERPFNLKILQGRELNPFRDDDRFGEALLFSKTTPDMLAVAAYSDSGGLLGLAGASRNCASMWEMGVNVLPEARNDGVASALIAALAVEVLKGGRLPYFNTCTSHLAARRAALDAGLYPAFCELRSRRAELESPFEDE